MPQSLTFPLRDIYGNVYYSSTRLAETLQVGRFEHQSTTRRRAAAESSVTQARPAPSLM
jgi:hypothetical protein